MTLRSLLFRADASIASGTGHVMRCLALAQAWQDAGGRAVFAMAEVTPSIRERLLAESCQLAEISTAAGTQGDARQTAALVQAHEADWVVVDGYQFAEDYQHALKSAGLKVLFVDDYGQVQHYWADVVLNQNVSAQEGALYASREPYTRLLLGTRYCMLRREFDSWRQWNRSMPQVGQRVLVTMGGSDPDNVSGRIIQSLGLLGIGNLEAKVVLGGSNPHGDSLKACAGGLRAKIGIESEVSNIAELMAWADVAVSAAGSTVWELCLLGVPTILIDIAPNQRAVAEEMDRRGCAIHLGDSRNLSTEKAAEALERLLKSEATRTSMSQRSRELVDGLGARRVVSALGAGLRLRPVRENDCRQLWEWANDSQVRAMAFSSAPIPWEQHEAWFASKMKNPECRIFIGEDGQGSAVGQFRVHLHSGEEGEIDVSLAPEYRGRGYASVLIDLGVNRAFAELRAKTMHAFIKPDNHASRRAFALAGFRDAGEETVHGHRAIHYVRHK